MKMVKIPTWILVTIGLLLNILSALMTNSFIDGKNLKVSQLQQRQVQNLRRIELTWQQIESLERKRENLLSLLNSEGKTGLATEISRQIHSDLSIRLTTALPEIKLTVLPAIMRQIDNNQARHRNDIDDIFLTNLTLMEQQDELSSNISKLRNLALFLQILGLALILARDLKRS